MRAIELTAKVTEDGKLMADLPPDIAPGTHRAVLVIDEQVEQQETTSTEKNTSTSPTESEPELLFNLHMIHWDIIPEDTSFSRDQLYDDDEY